MAPRVSDCWDVPVGHPPTSMCAAVLFSLFVGAFGCRILGTGNLCNQATRRVASLRAAVAQHEMTDATLQWLGLLGVRKCVDPSQMPCFAQRWLLVLRMQGASCQSSSGNASDMPDRYARGTNGGEDTFGYEGVLDWRRCQSLKVKHRSMGCRWSCHISHPTRPSRAAGCRLLYLSMSVKGQAIEGHTAAAERHERDCCSSCSSSMAVGCACR